MTGQLPELPDDGGIDPTDMTAAQLRDAAERWWAWLEQAQSARELSPSEEQAVDHALAVFNEVTRERRRRHAEEFPMRGS